MSSPDAYNKYIEGWKAVEFFTLRDMKEDLTGGHWEIKKLQDLHTTRAKYERFFWETLRSSGDPEGSLLRQAYENTLPYFDDVEMESYDGWPHWVDGREATARTLHYVSELCALCRWLSEVNVQSGVLAGADSTFNPAPVNPKYLGVWVGTISSAQDWMFLWRSPLPLYGLFLIPEGHPLHAQEIPLGHFHGDEVYRLDAFSSHLSVKIFNMPTSRLHHTRFGIPGPLPPSDHQPSTQFPWTGLRQVKTPSTTHFDPPSTISYKLPYTSYLFLDPTLKRTQSLDLNPDQQRKDRIAAAQWRELSKRLRSRPAGNTSSTISSVHPIEFCLPPRPPSGNKARYFMEQDDDCFYWPELISAKKAREYGNLEYYNHTLSSPNTFLVSMYPWPSLTEAAPPLEGEPSDDWLRQNVHHRIYVRQQPSASLLAKVASMPRLPSGANALPDGGLKRWVADIDEGYDNHNMDWDQGHKARLPRTKAPQQSHYSLEKLGKALYEANPKHHKTPPVLQHPPAAPITQRVTAAQTLQAVNKGQPDLHRDQPAPHEYRKSQGSRIRFSRHRLGTSKDQSPPRRRDRARSRSPKPRSTSRSTSSRPGTRLETHSTQVSHPSHRSSLNLSVDLPTTVQDCGSVPVASGDDVKAAGAVNKVSLSSNWSFSFSCSPSFIAAESHSPFIAYRMS